MARCFFRTGGLDRVGSSVGDDVCRVGRQGQE